MPLSILGLLISAWAAASGGQGCGSAGGPGALVWAMQTGEALRCGCKVVRRGPAGTGALWEVSCRDLALGFSSNAGPLP